MSGRVGMRRNFDAIPDQPVGQAMCTMPAFSGQNCDNAATCGNSGCTKQAAADIAARQASDDAS